MFERLRRDKANVHFLTPRERWLAAAARALLLSFPLPILLWSVIDPPFPIWWALVAVLAWVVLAAWPAAVVAVRHRERARGRRAASTDPGGRRAGAT